MAWTMPWMARSAVAILFLSALICAQAAPPAYPSNSSAFVASQNMTQQLVIGLVSTGSNFNDPLIYALTPQAYNAVDHSQAAVTGVGTGMADQRSTTNSNITKQSSNGPIAYIPCDNASYSGNIQLVDVVQDAISSGNASAILFYDTSAPFCNLTANWTGTFAGFNGNFFTMTNVNDSQSVLQQLQTASPTPGFVKAAILTQQSYANVESANNNPAATAFNNPEAGTTVAMYILYSITGVIALLFVVIIVTGAIRAHRHPERYGPRNVVGRPRQTRAQGIGRALLETIPLVRFGEDTPAKPADVELGPVDGHTEGETAATVAGPTGQTTSEGNDAVAQSSDGQATAKAQPSSSGAATTVTAEASGKAAGSMSHPEKVEKSLECAICWEDFEKGEEVRMLPCEHKFHPKCIDPWLLGFSGTCPVCRVDFGKGSKDEKPGEPEARTQSPAQS